MYPTFFTNCLGECKHFYQKTGNPNLFRPSVLTGWLLVVFFTGMLQQALAQNFNGSGRVSSPAQLVNFTQLAATQASRPQEQPALKVPNEYGERKTKGALPTNLPLPANAQIMRDQFGPIITPQAAPPFDSLRPNAPAPVTNFAALEDNNTTIPPDTHGAAGPNHVMVTLNSQVRIQTRTGTTLTTVSLNSFFGTAAFDPRIHYDPYNGRWIFVVTANAQSANSGWCIAISQNSDPTGNWYKYGVNDFDASNAEWADYPTVGFNKNWITIQINRFSLPGNNFTGTRIYALTKSEFYAGGTATWRLWTRNDIGGTQAPAVTYNNAINQQYLLQTWSGNSGGNGLIRMYTIDGAIGSETFTEGPFISTPNPWAGDGPDAPQLGSINRISTNGDRMQNVVYRNGSLWATHTIFLPAASPNRASVQWWQVSTAGAVQQRGRIDDGTAANFFAFPSIAVNSASNVLIGYSRFSGTRYASANYSFRLGTDAANTMQPDYTFKLGEDTYFKPSSGRNRWGDYSATVVDPVNDQDFWTIQEYAETSVGGSDRWGTWWARVSTISVPVPPAPTGLTATALNRSQIRLNWSDVSGETGYRIYRYGAEGYTQLATVGADVTTFTDSGLTAGTYYYYYLQAYNASGNSPQTPTIVANTASLSDYVMDGSPVSTCNGTFYDPGFNSKYGNNQSFTQTFSPSTLGSKVRLHFSYVDTESGFDVLRIYDGPTTASPLLGTYSGYTWPGLITATNATGQLTVQFTSNGSVVSSGWVATISCIFIPAPTGLTATALNRSQIRLNWSDVSGETGYRIYRHGSGGYTQLATVGADVTTFTDSGLTAGTYYYYYLQAYNAVGNSPQTSTVGTYTASLSQYVMDGTAVSTCSGTFYDPGFNSKYGNNQSFTQTFSPATLGSKVQLNFGYINTESTDVLRIYDGPTTASPLIGAYSGYTWLGVITATNATGQLTVQFTSNGSVVESGWQAAISCIFIAEPTNLTATALNRSQIRLTWSDVSGEIGYRIYRSVPGGSGGYTQIATVGANVTTFTDSGLTAGTSYAYYLQAYNAFGNSPSTPAVSAGTASLSEYVMDGTAVSTCNGTFYDPGYWGKYENNQSLTQTFSPATLGSKVRLTFGYIYTENTDVLRIYDGPTTASPLIGAYSGYTWLGVVTATNPTGQLTVQFTSNGSVVEPGWVAYISCVFIAEPTNLTATTLNRSQIRLNWSDVSGETGYRIYRQGSGGGYTQLATVGADVNTFTDNGLTAGTYYYYYLQAYNAFGNSPSTPTVGAYTASLSDYVMDGLPVSTCNGTFYDPGFNSKYGNNQSFTQTFSPATLGSKVQLNFGYIYTENTDVLRIYNGPTTASPLIGAYSGTTWLGLVTATNATGQLTVQFTSNGSVVSYGWSATISCVSASITTAPSARQSVEPALTMRLQAFPNPFSQKVTFDFTVEKTQPASLEIYDMKGVLVKKLFEGEARAGQHYQVEWDAALFKSGLFIGRLTSGNQSVSQKVILQR